MGIESAAGIWDLNELWPLGTDDRSTSDNHHRILKNAVKKTFPEISATVNVSAVEINRLNGVDQNIQDALDAYSLSISSINAKIDEFSLSISSINVAVEKNRQSISALNITASLVKETFHAVVDKSGTALYMPDGWVSSKSVSGVFVVTHGMNLANPYESAQYLGSARQGFLQIISAGANDVKIGVHDATQPRDSKFNLQIKLIP